MVDAKNFVEKELGKDLEKEEYIEKASEKKENTIPTYTPPPPPQQEKSPEEPKFPPQPIIQIVEKVIYKKQKIHGFFRTLTIIALVVMGFLMLGESTGLLELSVNSYKLHHIYPMIIILSTIILRSYRGLFGKILGLILFLGVFGWIFSMGVYTSLNPSTKQKEWTNIQHTTTTDKPTYIYIQTLIGNSYIEGSNKYNNIQWTWNSDRHIKIQSWSNEKLYYLKLNEDTNRNVLQNYQSKIDLILPEQKPFDLLYIKNFLWLHTIDLTTFKRKTLKFHAGINDITIRVGNVLSGNKIEIQGTAANINIELPNDIGAIVYHKHFLGKLEIAGFEQPEKRYYQSQNIKNAKAILHIYINLWASNTKINWKSN